MTSDANEEKESPDEDKGVGDVGQSSIKDNGLKVDGDVNDGGRRELQAQGILQVQQQQSQQTAVGWERFLNTRSVKVQLVENDDSTRHVVTALLRNCNYEVIEAANGLQAWKLLEALTNQVDLVLTEVVMPCLSGIGLLCKIMSHKTRKNIPVIMMSSYDSMGLVFNCLSKGAVDFLVKPIRKNELKNFWQHVWRRCHSSSGSGSESGAQTQKSVHTKSCEKSDNSGSNDGENTGSNGLNNGDESDDWSGTQSSWTKQPLEVDSSQAASPICQVAECPDRNCAQVNIPNADTSGNKRVHITAKKEAQEELSGTPNNLEHVNPINMPPTKVSDAKQRTLLEVPSSSSSARMNKGQANPSGELQYNIHNVINIVTSDPQMNIRETGPPRGLTNRWEIKNKTIHDTEKAAIELSSKRLRGITDAGNTIQDSHNILRHSELSAFSRYNTSSIAARAPNGITGSSYVIENSLEVAKKETLCGHSNKNLVFPISKVVSSNIDMGSTTNKFPAIPLLFSSEATSTINVLHPSSAFKLVKNDKGNSPQRPTQLKPVDMQASSVLSPARGMQQELQIQQPHHHHHHHHHFPSFEPPQQLLNHVESSLKKLAADTSHCGSWNVLSAPDDGDPGNHSLNRSSSGTNYGSTVQNRSSNSTAANTGGTNGESDMELGGRNGSRDANGSGCENRVDENKLAQGAAALLKFRQKRKERCFKKKLEAKLVGCHVESRKEEEFLLLNDSEGTLGIRS